MDLHVFRHGPAATAAEAGVGSDRERPLTEEGTDRTYRRARGVRRIVDALDVLATSPYRRAQQSARILADAYEIPHDEIEDLNVLRPDESPMKALEAVWKRYQGSVAVVGHKPHLHQLVAGALTGEPDGMDIHLATASLATVRITDDGAQLRRLVEPGVLEALG